MNRRERRQHSRDTKRWLAGVVADPRLSAEAKAVAKALAEEIRVGSAGGDKEVRR